MVFIVGVKIEYKINWCCCCRRWSRQRANGKQQIFWINVQRLPGSVNRFREKCKMKIESNEINLHIFWLYIIYIKAINYSYFISWFQLQMVLSWKFLHFALTLKLFQHLHISSRLLKASLKIIYPKLSLAPLTIKWHFSSHPRLSWKRHPGRD